MRRLVAAALVLAFVGLATVAQAAENPTGTWKWTQTMGERKVERTLELKLEGDKLTGAVLGRQGQKTAITEAKFKGGELSFTVVREYQGQKRTQKYTGKVSGDTIKGKIQGTDREGKETTTEWVAKREKKAA